MAETYWLESTRGRISRRRAIGGGLAAVAFLAACGGSSNRSEKLETSSLVPAREFVAVLQATEKWQNQARMPHTGAKLAPQTVAEHVRVLKAFGRWLYAEG